MRFILVVSTIVPPSASPHSVVECAEPRARTGEGNRAGSCTAATMSSTLLASTTARGCETRSPNQFRLSATAPAATSLASVLTSVAIGLQQGQHSQRYRGEIKGLSGSPVAQRFTQGSAATILGSAASTAASPSAI